MSSKKKGKLIIVSGPSGSGKSTIVRYLLKQKLNLVFSVSACSRSKREYEIDGKDYFFLDVTDFKKKIEANEFLEWEEVYKNSFYGTLKKEVLNKIEMGYNIIFDIDVIGAKSLKKIFDDQALLIYIQAPSINAISKRLNLRNTENSKQIFTRLSKAKYEDKEKSFFDYILVNSDLDEAKKNAIIKVKEFLN
ncbi:MAG: guanylate kinase [Flavobacteriales bacterium TMED113]|nr:MAG: guanylate kinase [Flavobacteriales bacterium TMED113]